MILVGGGGGGKFLNFKHGCIYISSLSLYFVFAVTRGCREQDPSTL